MNQWRNFTMAERLITEILTFAAGLKTKKEKIEYLQANSNRPLRTILKGAFDPTLQFNLPEGEPPYRKDDAPKGLSPSNLHRISRRFKYFNKGGIGDRISAVRREKMFIDCLESLHPDEAELVIWMKDKKLAGKYKGITKALIKETFPTIISEGVSTPSEAEEKQKEN